MTIDIKVVKDTKRVIEQRKKRRQSLQRGKGGIYKESKENKGGKSANEANKAKLHL